MHIKEINKSFIQLFHFGIVGITTNLLVYIVYFLMTNYWGTSPKITMSFLYCFGVVASFMGNSKLTFAHKGNLIGSGVRFLLAHFFGYLINLMMLLVMVDTLGYSHFKVQAMAIVIVAALLFVMCKLFVFPNSTRPKVGF